MQDCNLFQLPSQFGREFHQQQRCQIPESSSLGEPDTNVSEVRSVKSN